MHGMGIRTVAMSLFVAAWIMFPPGLSAAIAEDDGDTGYGFWSPYLSIGMAAVSPENVRFTDGADSGNAALYGSENTFDDGSFADSPQALFAAGVHLRSSFRLQLEYGLTRELDYSGNTNYQDSGTSQPSKAVLDTQQALLVLFRDFAAWEYAAGRSMQPFLGIGAGVSKFRLSDYTQRFPQPPNPQGSLRRGPGGEIPFTALPPGSDREFTTMLTAGVAIPVGENAKLDLSYRYTDAGKIHTDIGDINIVRYRYNGQRREIPVKINETHADLRTHSLSLALRFEW